jgi:hypothetical protein
MKPVPCLFALLLLAFSQPASALDVVRYDGPCAERTGALRQTVIILDEALVERAPRGEPLPESNRRWVQPLLQMADAGSQPFGVMMPHELLTVFVAERGTSELAQIFHGCSPNLSQAELDARLAESSPIASFFLGSVEDGIADEHRKFQDALVSAYGALVRDEAPPEALSTEEPQGFFNAIASAPALYDLSNGVPRLLLITPFRMADATWNDQAGARHAGFADAARLNIDLQRAEVYVVATDAGRQLTQDYADALLLGIKGHLAGWRQTGLPTLANGPVRLEVFGGSADLAGIDAPVQFRLAVDAQGTLVNSWIEVTRLARLATPVEGKLICRDAGHCTVKGEGRFAQAWSETPLQAPAGAESMFGEALVWSGFRQIEVTIAGDDASAWIYEPNVIINITSQDTGTVETIEGYRVPMTRSVGQVF